MVLLATACTEGPLGDSGGLPPLDLSLRPGFEAELNQLAGYAGHGWAYVAAWDHPEITHTLWIDWELPNANAICGPDDTFTAALTVGEDVQIDVIRADWRHRNHPPYGDTQAPVHPRETDEHIEYYEATAGRAFIQVRARGWEDPEAGYCPDALAMVKLQGVVFPTGDGDSVVLEEHCLGVAYLLDPKLIE